MNESPTTHACAAEGCATQIGRQSLMCKPHWKFIPAGLRVKLGVAYRDWQRGGETFAEGRVLVARLRAVQAECVAAVGFVRV